MPLRKFVEKFTKPVDEQDREQLVSWCAERGGAPLDGLELRRPVRIVGEIRSVRIVPRAGAASLEATVQDGRGTVTAVFLGRRKIAAMKPGRRLIAEGVATARGPERLVYNPWYRFLPR